MISDTLHTEPATHLKTFSRVTAAGVVGLGCMVLAGWAFGVAILKTGLPGLIAMKVNTALGFVLAGLALLLAGGAVSKWGRRAGTAGTVLLFTLGVSALVEHLFAVDLGIDELLFRDDSVLPEGTLPGRMSPVTAFCFCMSGLSIALLRAGGVRRHWVALWCAVPVLAAAVQALVGYVYGVSAFYQLKPFSALAVHTAVGFVLLSLAIFESLPSRGFMKVVTSATAGGYVSRRLLPFILVGVSTLGWLCLAGVESGRFDNRFGYALMALLAMAFSSVIVLWHAGVLYRTDIARGLAEASIIELNAGLEHRVLERTRELQKALDEVKQLSGLLPICAWCKMVRDDKNYWQSVEGFITTHTDAKFSHGVCPTCLDKAENESG